LRQNKGILKKALLVFTLLVLFLPLLQSRFHFMNLYPLAGDEGPKSDTTLTFSNYCSGVYQHKLNERLASGFGFRSLLIKINNQINFSLFNKVNARGVIAGKEEYLFEATYINAQLGKDFMGGDSINSRLKQLKLISDKLQALNKQLLLVIAPSKPSFYKEFLPGEYLPGPNISNNYRFVSKGIKEQRLNCIDFSAYFNTLKPTCKYPLYPKHGNHWSTYGAYLAADSIIKSIEWLRKTDLPDLSVKSLNMEQPKNDDKDIEYGINLLFKLKSFDLAYPEIAIDTNGKTKPNVLVIGDSFYWNLYHLGINRCFKRPQFWYYNQAVYPVTAEKQVMTNELNFNEEIAGYDVIIILATESNIHKLGWGFMEQAQKYLDRQVIN
jgi:hypothetical protein